MTAISKKQETRSLGDIEARLLERVRDLKSPGIRIEDAGRLLPWPGTRLEAAFKRLVAKGQLVRFARSRYYLATEDPSRVACHAWAPSYVSFLTVLADAGFTEQIPRRLDLAYARPSLRTKRWGSLPITWHPIPADAFSGYSARADGALIATPAKAAADLVHRQRDFGGLAPYRSMVEEALRRRPAAEVDEALDAYAGQGGTLRRLLYLRFGPHPVPSRWKRRLGTDLHNPIRLDTTLPGAGVRRGGLLNILEVEA